MTTPELTAILDELVRRDLQALRDSEFRWLLISTVVVAVGVLLEEAESIPFTKTRLNVLTGLTLPRHRLIAWVKRAVRTGWLLIVIGVIGEGIFEARVSQADGFLQTFNETLLSAANERAEAARAIAKGFEAAIASSNAEAKKATERAVNASALAKGYESQTSDSNARVKTAEAQVASANAESRKAVATVATAEARIAEAQRDAAEARKETENERLARVKIEETLAGWKFSAEARERLIKKLKPFPDTPFDLFVNPVEAPFVDLVDSALGDAGWKRQQPKGDVIFASKAAIVFSSGITIEVALDRWNVFGPAASALTAGLIAEGIPAKGLAVKQGSDPSAIHVVIGRRQ